MAMFKENLKIGKIGEDHIARWLNSRGFNLLPVYEKEISEGKGPTVYAVGSKRIIAPDLLAFKSKKTLWIEAKSKTAFTWHRKTSRWVTGIDLKHYDSYLMIQEIHPDWPVWMMFLHRRGCAKDTPDGMICPSGLFGAELSYLAVNENHRHGNWGKGGMVYWAHDKLKQLDTLENVTDI